MNVNTTDATIGVTALILPAQNTLTLHDPIWVVTLYTTPIPNGIRGTGTQFVGDRRGGTAVSGD